MVTCIEGMSDGFHVTIAGAFAGAVGTLLGFPLDTIKTKMQTNSKEYSSMLKTYFKIIRKEGYFNGLYRGIGAPMVSLTILNMVNFSNYECCKGFFSLSSENINTGEFNSGYIFAGACIGPIAALISTPFELVKTQMQLSKMNGIYYNGSIDAALSIGRTYGFTSLYKGHFINSLREIVFLGTYFGVYEHMKANVSILPDTLRIPLSGGISGAVGWFVSIPLDCIKTKIQGQSFDLLPISSSNTIAVASELIKSRGIVGLYTGVAPSVTRAFIVSSSRFSAYELAIWGLDRYSRAL